jgi:hypothetical protein
MADEMAAMMVFGEIGNTIKKTVRDLRIANKEDPRHVREIYISISPSSMALAYRGDIMSAMGLMVPLCSWRLLKNFTSSPECSIQHQ